jgi:hypothetical protein
VQPREIHELLEHAHLRVETALFGDVAEPAPSNAVDDLASPPDLAAVGFEHTEGDPHGGRLARTVRADESDHGPLIDVEAHPVQRHDVAEPATEIDQLETGEHRAQDRERIRYGREPRPRGRRRAVLRKGS